ncbi:glycoside hydrolase family 47 protein [Daldinia caldariorum]|uniref:glycoside hydrolase family 47 protein n=1 Tax=Daldinia caldariorum TaxID=326644 RepID=UPI002008325A|nr:glycoside hydrolase family 47 protein [Daldinia caldariorum]KAI1464093.1 glycoside hydrolase family 47 protein [Daldinia caldariorum]
MPLPGMGSWTLAISDSSTNHGPPRLSARLILPFVLLSSWLGLVESMRPSRISELRRDTVDMFYHGFDNYMNIAFPEDELRPVSCTPLTRDSLNPRNIALNDVLGNYSLTLIDSLSSLGILASSPPDDGDIGPKALRDFQDGVAALVTQYGDGRPGPSGQGARARGFDVDSKVQVFETVIRGVGGLLSAHLFAVGDLPISGYEPQRPTDNDNHDLDKHPIPWPNGFKYDGQLLRLALDLAQRLLPAFYTQTGLPYPRVNLRHGIPFYVNSPLHNNANVDPRPPEDSPEITETCSAGAGSLVLEFTVLSRLTGDPRFEQAAKRAFWAVWSRRSNIGLIGAGVDAEEGHWIGGFSGIGAGIDSFFEYALKTHILLSGHELPNRTIPQVHDGDWLDPNQLYNPLSDEDNSPDSFLSAWHHAHAAIKRHLYSGLHHPHYVNAHMSTGSPQAYWIDSLGAYYSGLLALAGELDEAIETHLVYSALWTRYSALPERWSVRDGNVEGGLGWWPGRPEFIESTYHLYRATQDPWYLYVGEMVLKDITRRCWTECGWSGLQDVRTGEKSDRMESFFLGETAKYLYLLFDPDHPLNKLDASYVFTTEGHPLIIPRKRKSKPQARKSSPERNVQSYYDTDFTNTCPRPPVLPPLSGSATAARPDLYNAATLIRLHQVPNIHSRLKDPIAELDESEAQTKSLEKRIENYTYFPWTLPSYMLPADGICAVSKQAQTTVIEFASNGQQTMGSAFNIMFGGHNLVRMGGDGIAINSLSGLKLALIVEDPPETTERAWRVYSIGNLALGRDEKVLISRDVLEHMSDPLFHRVRDSVLVDILLQLEPPQPPGILNSTSSDGEVTLEAEQAIELDGESTVDSLNIFSSFLQQITSALREPVATFKPEVGQKPDYKYVELPGITPVGVGAAPLPDIREAPNPHTTSYIESLSWQRIFFADHACGGKLPDEAAKAHQVIVMRRGGCSFSQKLANIPSFAPNRNALQLVVVVSDDKDARDENENEPWGFNFIRPLLDEPQRTPAGFPRHHPIAMLMTGGGQEVYDLLRKTRSLGIRRRYHVESQGLKIGNIVVL